MRKRALIIVACVVGLACQRSHCQDRTAESYRWINVTNTAVYTPRDGAGALVFHDRMWVLEGYHQDGGNRQDVWYSADGVTWHELSDTPWKSGHAASVFVFADALWMVVIRKSNDPVDFVLEPLGEIGRVTLPILIWRVVGPFAVSTGQCLGPKVCDVGRETAEFARGMGPFGPCGIRTLKWKLHSDSHCRYLVCLMRRTPDYVTSMRPTDE